MAEQLEVEDFDTAKAIFEKLKDVPADRRKRILSWVAEGLGVVLHAPSAPVAAPMVHRHATLTPAPQPERQLQAQTADIKTFVTAKAPKSDVQFAATVAYYYRFEAPAAQRRETLDGATLQEAARLAGRKRLA